MNSCQMNEVRRHACWLALLFVPGVTVVVSGQHATSEEAAATRLVAGGEHAGTLEVETPAVYTVDVDANQFIHGVAHQIDVDVVVAVRGPQGNEVARFDTGGRGPEPFQFDAVTAGVYHIEVAPFEMQTGKYTIELSSIEPLATTPHERVDQLMAAYDHPQVPGGVVAVVENGELSFARAYGAANLADEIPFTVDTHTNIGSTAKQFTAFAIMLLNGEGKLSLDDDVRTHIPELPEFDHTVTLRHLLTHTSGYREFLNTLAMGGRRIGDGDSIERKEIIEVIQRQPELQNVPGEEWNYNNSGYGLLATVVERVGGKAFPAWMAENVFEPLGMRNTVVRSRTTEIIARRAVGYVGDDKHGYREAVDLGGSTGAGGIYTTVGDLARWVRNLHTGELGGSSVIEAMTTSYVLNSGEPTHYGFGFFIDEHRGMRRFHHGGADTAHRSMLMYFPEIDAAVITQSNNDAFNGGIADQVAAAFFEAHMMPEDSGDADDTGGEELAFDPATFDADSLDAFVGRYSMDEMPSFILTFSREGDRFITQATGQPELPLTPTSPNTFEIPGVEASITFHIEDDGSVKTLTLHQNGDHPARRLEEAAWEPSADELAGYAGRYFSEELETFYTVDVEDGNLMIRHRRFDDVKLTPASVHEFTGGFPIAMIVFVTGDGGAVTGLIASNGRARDIRFDRIE